MLKQGWRGYIFSRPIGGQIIPQRVQNLVIRDHCRRHDLLYLLSAVEYGMDGCFMMLRDQAAGAASVEGLICYSTHLLPPDPGQRAALFDAFLTAGGGIRFALEDLVVDEPAQVALIEDILMCRALARSTSEGLF